MRVSPIFTDNPRLKSISVHEAFGVFYGIAVWSIMAQIAMLGPVGRTAWVAAGHPSRRYLRSRQHQDHDGLARTDGSFGCGRWSAQTKELRALSRLTRVRHSPIGRPRSRPRQLRLLPSGGKGLLEDVRRLMLGVGPVEG